MPRSDVFIESKSIRESSINHTEVLDKVKILPMLPDNLHISIPMAAEYFEVGVKAIESLIHDNRDEIESDGLQVLKGTELTSLKEGGLIDKYTAQFAIVSRRAALRMGMLLRDSPIAIRVRTYLLNIEQFHNEERPPQIVQDYLQLSEDDRAIAYFRKSKQVKVQAAQIEQDRPYTNFGKQVSHSNGAINIGDFCKIIYQKHGVSMGRNKMFAWLRDHGYLIKSGREKNSPKQIYVDQGLFISVPTIVARAEGDVQRSTTMITGKGQVKITHQILSENGLIEGVIDAIR